MRVGKCLWHKLCAVGSLAVILCGHSSGAIADTPHLVRNINTTVSPASSAPNYLGVLNNTVLFGATDATGGGLWATDATGAGARLVYRVAVLAQSVYHASPNYLVLGDRGYFAGNDGVNGPQLWSTDGTAAGTAMVANLGPSGTSASPRLLGSLGSQVIFTKPDASGTTQLYASDGSSAGTHALTSLVGQSAYVGTEFLAIGNKFYFVTGNSTGVATGQIWVSDGTPGGTQPVANPYGTNTGTGAEALYHPQSFTLVGTSFLYVSEGLLWSVDTTTDTLSAVSSADGFAGFGPPNGAANLIGFGTYALFTEYSGSGEEELWRSDGTTSGTYEVAVINAGFGATTALLEKVGGRVLFLGTDAQYGTQLWSSDGTSANTVRLTNASEPANSPWPVAIYHQTLGGLAYLSVADGAQSTTWSMWVTDGTPAGTQRAAGLPSIDPSEGGPTQFTGDANSVFVEVPDSSSTTELLDYEPASNSATLLKSDLSISGSDDLFYSAGWLYFSANDPALGDEPWVSDGTPAGTKLLADLNPQTSDMGSDPNEFVGLNGALVFVAADGVSGRELWTSDGTAGGTTLLADVNPGPGSSNPSNLFVSNSVLYFFATDANGTQNFMRLSGTPVSVQTLAALSPSLNSRLAPVCGADRPVSLNGKVYFAANDGAHGLELWSTDGTAAGTNMVSDINAGAADSSPCALTVFNGKLYFSAVGPAGRELWVSDGTSSGTAQVADINPGGDSSPIGLNVFSGALYFSANSGNGSQLWRSDGSASGTASVGNFVPNANTSVDPVGVVSGKLLFELSTFITSPTPSLQQQLWASDGTSTGTVSLNVLTMDEAYLNTSGALYFASPGPTGIEPWISDGTSAGTHLLKEINPTAQMTASWFANFNGVGLLAFDDPAAGASLWRSDGTAAGTTQISGIPVDDSRPRFPRQSDRHQLTVGQTFFFVGNDPSTGAELYALSNEPPVASPYSVGAADGQSVSINVLGNDSDPDGALDPSSIRITTNPAHGTATATANGTVLYTPDAGFSGTDAFSYTINDNQGAVSNAATITLSVTAAATPVTTTSTTGHGGGGAMDIETLLALMLACAYRRKAVSRANVR